MVMKLYTYPQNTRAYKSLIAAKYVGAEIEVPAFDFAKDRTSEEFKKVTAWGKVPALQTENGPIFESNAMARYVARLGGDIYGKTAYETSLNDQWIDFASNEIDPTAVNWLYSILGYVDYNAKETARSKENLKKALTFLDAQLLNKSFLTGPRVALADIIVACSLMNFYKMVMDAAFRQPFVNVNRWFTTLVNQPNFKAVIGEFVFCEKMMVYVAPKKEVKEEVKPVKAAAPKKEVNEDEEEAAAPKKKNPLDELAPSTFVLDEFKRMYSNNETNVSIPWFFSNFDNSGFSIYKCSYKYNEELEAVFKTCNLIGGFFQRLETLHKYAFGSIIIFGEEQVGAPVKNQTISGIWVFRGNEIPADMKDCDDSLVYDWTKLDVAADKDLITAYLAWENFPATEGKFLQGKLYK